MGAKLRSHLTYANLMASAAVFIALGSGAYAVGLANNSVKSKHIKDGQIQNADLADAAVNSVKVANASLLGEDFAPGQLPAGPAGAQGPKGDKGDKGDPGRDGTNGTNGSPDTAAQILAKLITVDGAGSGLDADLVDGFTSSAFAFAADALLDGDPAGGDLAGSYPNPVVGPTTIGSAEVSQNSLTADDVSDSSTLDTDEINEAGLTGLVDAVGSSTLTRDFLDMGEPFNAADPDTFIVLRQGAAELRTTDDIDKFQFCVFEVPFQQGANAIAYMSGVRSNLGFSPGGPACQLLDINGASGLAQGDFQLWLPTSGLWINGASANGVTPVFAFN